MVTHLVEKTSGEVRTITVDATGVLPSGVTISSFSLTATERSTGDTDDTVIGDLTPVFTNTTGTIILTGGTDGESYLVKGSFLLSNSDIREFYIILKVVNPA